MAIRREDFGKTTKRFNPQTGDFYQAPRPRLRLVVRKKKSLKYKPLKKKKCLCKGGGKRCTKKICRKRYSCSYGRNPSNNRCFNRACSVGSKRKRTSKNYFVCRRRSGKKLKKDLEKLQRKLEKLKLN